MKKLFFLSAIFVMLLFFTACKKNHDIIQRKTINVSDIAQLYAAANDTANADVIIILASGTYLLDSTQPSRRASLFPV